MYYLQFLNYFKDQEYDDVFFLDVLKDRFKGIRLKWKFSQEGLRSGSEVKYG